MQALTPNVSSLDHVSGLISAPIELVEFGDFECPSCGLAFPLIKNLRKTHRQKVKFIFRNFPLTQIHPHAMIAAVAAEAAGKQSRFWEMHDLLFKNQSQLDRRALAGYASKLELNLADFAKDLTNPEIFNKIDRDIQSGIKSGVDRTPTFFINGRRFAGDWLGNGIAEYIESLSVPA